ncbi:MAG: PAS domain S-box protein [Prolixibacteraceae bacterium]|nr:PAS domain S-box protein [Prolixibacteraceae bacterium]
MFVVEIIYNLALLVAISVLAVFIDTRWSSETKFGAVFQGVLFASATLIGMMQPFVLSPGIIFDGRTVILSICGLFFGPISVAIAASAAFVYRFSIGGTGLVMGLLTIVSSALVGVVFHYYFRRTKKTITTLSLLTMGLLVHLFMISLMVFLPSNLRSETLRTIGMTVIIVYPLTTILIGKILKDQQDNVLLNIQLTEGEEKYRLLVESQTDLVVKVDTNACFLYVSQTYCQTFGKTEEELLGKQFYPLVHEEDIEPTLREMEKLKYPPHTCYIEQRALTQDGWRWFGWSDQAILNDQGEVEAIVGVGRDITRRVEIETALLESREELSITLMSIGDGVITTNVEGRVTRMNKVAEQMIGLPYDQCSGRMIAEVLNLVNAETREPIENPVDKVLKLKQVVGLSNQTLLISNHGKAYHISDSAAPIIDAAGNVTGVIMVFSDVTSKYQTQSDLKKERNLLRHVIDALPFSLYIKDTKGRKLLVNKTEVKYLGRPFEEIIGKTDAELYPDDYASSFEAFDRKVIEAGASIVDHIEAVPMDNGDKRWISTTKLPWYDEQENITGLIGFGIDITDRLKDQEKIRTLSEGIEQSPTAIIITNQDGLIEYVNPRFIEMTGYQSKDVMGRYPRILKPKADNAVQLEEIWTEIKAYRKWKGEYLSRKHSGEEYWESLIIAPITNNMGLITNLLLIIEDISDRKAMIQELTNAKRKAEESDQLKTAFLANMSHEIRTPMNGILGFAELLRETDLKADTKLQYLEVIEQSGYRMLNIINDIIDISKIEAGEISINKKPFHVNELIRYQLQFFESEAERKGLSLKIQLGLQDDNDLLFSDENRVEQVMVNLIKNAIKFTKTGGIVFGYAQEGSMLRFFVSDTGLGIDEVQQKQIFERFRQADMLATRRYEGAGLGLSISKALVEMMGGHIGVMSEKGQGSTFFFTIPFDHQ